MAGGSMGGMSGMGGMAGMGGGGAPSQMGGSHRGSMGEMHGMMHETFYWGDHLQILFSQWKTNNIGFYILSLLAVFTIAALKELLTHLAERLTKEKEPTMPVKDPSTSLPFHQKKWAQVSLQTLLHVLNASVHYFLMLIVMSYNVGVFLAVLAGLGLGYILFRAH